MERSNDRGGAPKTAVAVPPPLRPDATPVHVLRDRIRNASAAAAKRNSTLPPPPAPAGRTLSSPPEHSGVRSRPAERVAANHVSTSSLFAPNAATLRPPAVPRETTLSPEPVPSGKQTQLGLGAVQPMAADRSKKVTPDLTTAKTQPMPRVSVPATTPSAAVAQVGSSVVTPTPKTAAKTGPIKSPVPGLLRASQPATPREGRYSVRDVSAEYIEPRTHSSPPSVPAVPLRDDPPTQPLQTADDDDDLLSRSRRSTPKERPGRRRPTHLTREEVAAKEEASAQPPPLPPRRNAAPTVEEHVAPDPAALSLPVAPSVPPAAITPTSEPPVVVDPQLGAVTTASKAPAPNTDRYTPLPNDRESFEAFMRERMKDPAHARPGWSEQETKLISRDALRGKDKRSSTRRRWMPLGTLVIAAACIAAGAWWFTVERSLLGSDASQGIAAQERPAVVGAVTRTLIVTEPAGAEIVVGGAVIGNTPSEVPRVAGDELYLLRLSGFESQLVRLTPHTRDVVRVTLKPLGMAESPVVPAAR